jgi:lipid-binding SYLF domain-containing protein
MDGKTMISNNRRQFALGLIALGGIAACSNGIGNNNAAEIDARIDAALSTMYQLHPGAQNLSKKAAGMLVMPLITEAGIGLGTGYVRGALQIEDVNVDYYSSTSASAGLQIGFQQYSYVLFFMTESALREFRTANGWVAGANVEYVYKDQSDYLGTETTSATSDVVAIIFAQAGMRFGATLDGTKYSRIIP